MASCAEKSENKAIAMPTPNALPCATFTRMEIESHKETKIELTIL